MTTNEAVPLLPCPFCGLDPRVETWTEIDRTWPEPNEIQCERISCCVSGRDREAWNRRFERVDVERVRAVIAEMDQFANVRLSKWKRELTAAIGDKT